MKQINKNILNEKGSPRYRLGEAGMTLQILILIVVIIGIAVGVFLVQRTQIFKSRATDSKTNSQVQTQSPVQEVKPDPAVESLTNELLKLDKQYDQTVQTNPDSSPKPQGGINSPDVKGEQTSAIERAQLNKMIDVAKKRKELLLNKLKDGKVEDFLINANLSNERDTFQDSVKLYIEKRFEKQGELIVIHKDNFNDKKSTDEYLLSPVSDPNNTVYILHGTKDLSGNTSGEQVKVYGLVLDNQVALQPNNTSSAIQILATPTVLSNIGEQKTLVLLVNTLTSPVSPYTKNQISNMVFNTANANSVNNYYKETSKGKTFLSGDVFGWYSINYNGCISSEIGSLARQKASLSNVNVQDYHRIIYVLAGNIINCFPTFAGLSTGGGDPTESWIIVVNEGIFAHEFGHQLGLMHANNIICQQGKITPTTCNEGEYGDAHDVMGLTYQQFNAPHQFGLGWLPESNIQTVTSDGVFTIIPLESATTGTQVLKIAKPDTDSTYFISYRQNGGFFDQDLDGIFPNSIRSGASIHTWKDNSFETTKFIERQGSFYGATILDNETFQDQINNFQIKQIRHDINGVTIEVKFSAPPPPPSSYRRVFLTSTQYNGDLKSAGSNVGLGSATSGLDGADKICQSRANAAKLGGDWKAWLSDSNNSVSNRISHSGIPYKNLRDSTIANEWNDLISGNLRDRIEFTEFKTQYNGADVWTGTQSNATATGVDCSNWTNNSNTIKGTAGFVGFLSSWTKFSDEVCTSALRLYCFEEPIVNPSPSPVISPSPVAVYTVSYKVGESPADLVTATETPYGKEPLGFDYVFKDPTPGAKFLFVEFKDNMGNLATKSAQLELLPPTQQLSLTSGWNLVSLNVEPSNPSLTNVLKPLEGRYTRVLAENGIFATTIDDKYNTLRELHAGKAYYLRLSDDATANLQVNGSRDLASRPLNLHKGWNWVGYMPTTAMKVTDALQAIAGKYQLVISLDKVYDVNRPDFTTLEEMVPGQGYLIHMTEAADLIYPAVTVAQSLWTSQVAGVSSSGCSPIPSTPFFALAYGQVVVNGISAPVGTHIEAVTPRGDAVGCFVVKNSGQFGIMYLYGEDTSGTPSIPGFKPNETIAWRLNGQIVVSSSTLTWQDDRIPREISLNFTTSPSPSPSASPVVPPPPPAGGGGGGGSGGGGGGSSSGGGGSAPAKKTIKYVKYAEDPYSLSSAPRVPYYPGDTLPYTFKNSPQGNKYFIFIRFEDENGQIFKINGQDYITQSIDVYSGEVPTPSQPVGGDTPPSTGGNTEQVTIGTISLSTSSSVSSSGNGWSPVSISLSLSGFSSPGRSIAGLFVRNQTGECSINDCGYSGWTQIRSYGTNGTDTNSWTPSGDLSSGVHMFAAFSLNADGTAGQLLAVSKTNFGSSSTTTTTGGTSNGANTPNTSNTSCIPLTQSPDNATSCSCTNSDSSAVDFAGKCYMGTGQSNGQGGCNGGWCNGGKCQTCSP